MGAEQSAPAAQVRERHLRALYINVPVPVAELQALLTPPARPQVHAGSGWISIVVDDLFQLENPVPGGFVTVPGMNGWMMKLNALVEAPLEPGGAPVAGYQILTLDFEQTSGPSSWAKVVGARLTQRVPSFRADFAVSSGATGETEASPMAAGTPYSCAVTAEGGECEGGSEELVVVRGAELAELGDAAGAVELAAFVCAHSTKFLAQGEGESALPAVEGKPKALFCASWREGWSCSAEGAMLVSIAGAGGEGEGEGEVALPVLARLGLDPALAAGAVCFLQPEYSMVDVKNTPVPSSE